MKLQIHIILNSGLSVNHECSPEDFEMDGEGEHVVIYPAEVPPFPEPVPGCEYIPYERIKSIEVKMA